MTSGVV